MTTLATRPRNRREYDAQRTMGLMTAEPAPEYWGEPEHETEATVLRLVIQDPNRPTDAEIAEKKARRRLGTMTQSIDRHGVVRPHYFNQAGYDAWGYDERGQYDPAQRIADTPNPFAHH